MKRVWKRLWDEERGQNISEYALILVLVSLLGASVASVFGVTIHSTYSTVCAAITNPSLTGTTTADSGSNADNSPAASSSSSSNSGSDSSSGSNSGNGNGHGNGNGKGKDLALGHQ